MTKREYEFEERVGIRMDNDIPEAEAERMTKMDFDMENYHG